MTDLSIEADAFASTVESILGDVDSKVQRSLPAASRKAAQFGVKSVRYHADEAGIKGSGAYKAGWSYRSSQRGRECFAEIGNKDLPGLPHLLEKGHATIGGGRVRAIPHIAPAAEETFDRLEEEVGKAVEEAMS